MEEPTISLLEEIASKGFLVVFGIITLASSGALAFLAIKKLKNSTVFLLAALGHALPCYGFLVAITSYDGTVIEDIVKILTFLNSYTICSIPLFFVGALGLLDFCKEKGFILSRFKFIHKILHYGMIAFTVWHLGIIYAPMKTKVKIDIGELSRENNIFPEIMDDKYMRDILVADFWISAIFIGFTCFLLAVITRLMTRIALGVYFSIFFVYAVIWSTYATDQIAITLIDPLLPEKVALRSSVILGAFLPASLAAIIFLYARENPDDSETLL